jgi:hypothetical protein
MLKKAIIILLALVLLIAPLVLRWFYYYEGQYAPEEAARPDLTKIDERLPETRPFTDLEVSESRGSVLVDFVHGNHVQMAELDVLQARLAARGHTLQPVYDAEDLEKQLHHAQALAIISPGVDWTPDQIQLVEGFVDKGGRLLLVTDPSRFEVSYDEWGYFIGLDSDVPHINDLASRFGFVFQDDYLYNTVENEGNFRNIVLTDLADGQLTEGLDELVFFAAHSISSREPALLTAGGETRSSTSEREQDLTVGLLAADGAVLALGDLTFMTEPNNAVRDNDQFVANIADFLTGAQRRYDLADFPHFFGDEVHLVYTGAPLLDSDLVQEGSALQTRLGEYGKTMTLRAEEDEASDTLFLGLYEQAEEVESYLEAAQVTLVFTPTATLDDEELDTPSDQPLTSGSTITSTTQPTITETLDEDVEETETGKNRVVVEQLGEMSPATTSLLLLQTEGGREVMVALANSETGLKNALERLNSNDLEGCLLHEVETSATSLLALCPSGEVAPEGEGGGWQEPEQEPGAAPPEGTEPEEPPEELPEEPLGSIIIVALDEDAGRYDSMTSALDYYMILQDSYEVTTWSIAEGGLPGLEELTAYDLSIWTAGDHETTLEGEAGDLLFSLMFEGVPVILSGAYVSDSATESVQRDIQVNDASHPLALGFEDGEIIDFVTPPSGSDYEIALLEDFTEEDGALVFVRGPNSEASGQPSVLTLEDEFGTFRLVYICFPVYLLPEGPKEQLVENAAYWLLSP